MRLRQGDFDQSTVVRRRPGRPARAFAEDGADCRCTSSTSTAPARASRCTPRRWRASPRPSRARSTSAAGCARARPSRRPCATGVEPGRARHRGRSTTATSWRGRSTASATAWSWRSTRARARSRRTAGPRSSDRDAVEVADGAGLDWACAASSTPTSTATGRWGAQPRPRCAAWPRPRRRCDLIASGGIASLDDLRRLRDLRLANLDGVIVGRALYEGRFTVAEALEALGAGAGVIRVIPCLDVDEGRVVKGVNFVGLRDAGDPVELAARYDAEGADELVFLDITATHEERETIVELARRTADNVFIPFTIGGGIRSRGGHPGGARRRRRQGLGQLGRGPRPGPDRARVGRASAPSASWSRSTRSGATTAAAGRSSSTAGRLPTGRDAVAWAAEAAERGAGELLLTSMDRDGTKDGYDLELLAAVADAAPVPVIASGGAGSLEHLAEAITRGPGRRGAGGVDLPRRRLLDRRRSRRRWPTRACRSASRLGRVRTDPHRGRARPRRRRPLQPGRRGGAGRDGVRVGPARRSTRAPGRWWGTTCASRPRLALRHVRGDPGRGRRRPGATWSRRRCTCTDLLGDFPAMNEVYATAFAGHAPARATVGRRRPAARRAGRDRGRRRHPGQPVSARVAAAATRPRCAARAGCRGRCGRGSRAPRVIGRPSLAGSRPRPGSARRRRRTPPGARCSVRCSKRSKALQQLGRHRRDGRQLAGDGVVGHAVGS